MAKWVAYTYVRTCYRAAVVPSTLTKWRRKLFAGITCLLTKVRDAASASAVTSATSLYPHSSKKEMVAERRRVRGGVVLLWCCAMLCGILCDARYNE